MARRHIILIFILFVCAYIHADTTFSPTLSRRGDNTLILSFKGEVEEGWHINGEFELEESDGVSLRGALQKVREGHFIQMLTITGEKYSFKGYFQFVACDDEKCLAPQYVDFTYEGEGIAKKEVKDEKKDAEDDALAAREAEQDGNGKDAELAAAASPTDTIAQKQSTAQADDTDLLSSPLWQPANESNANSGLLHIIFLGFIGGLLALFTPCVWPIIPLTVSFFIKRKNGTGSALLFGGCIISLFVTLGILVTLLFGENAMNILSTSATFNIVCFAILIIFGLSLIGLFELKLPMEWGNLLDEKAEKATGIVSIFFMALTLVVVSFSCTAPVVGLLLVEVATDGNFLAPIAGLTSFALALALPFTIFALFPQWMQRMPRSGAWMNHIKVILGVLELAFSLKFLSVADQTNGWNILSADTILIIWIALCIGLAIYFVAKLSRLSRILIPLMPLAVAALLANSLTTGDKTMFAAFLPVEQTSTGSTGGKHKVFRDYEEGMAYAKEHNMRVFIDFTGYGCVNCRKMEGAVFTDERVRKKLENDFVVIELYVDERTPLPKQQHVTIDGKQRTLRTVGDKWSLLESYKFGSQSQPLYVILSSDGKALSPTYGYDEDIDKFLKFLE